MSNSFSVATATVGVGESCEYAIHGIRNENLLAGWGYLGNKYQST